MKRRLDNLCRQPFVAGKSSTKDFVTLHDLVQRAFEHRSFDSTLHVEREVDVVCGATACELVKKPQALLREGERCVAARRSSRDALRRSEFDTLFFK
jgi:hypothetical protein